MEENPIKFNIITTCYNVEQWIDKCISSVKEQTYPNWKMFIADDCSTDDTLKVIQENKHPQIMFGQPGAKSGNLSNQVNLIRQFSDPDSIIIHLDGDDWLADHGVLEHLKEMYYSCSWTLATYGNYRSTDGRPSVCAQRRPYESYRYSIIEGWKYSHLRTYKRFLFDHVKNEDLKDSFGNYFPFAPDVALFLPILEMAAERVGYCDRINAIYNRHNALNEDKVNLQEQVRCALEIYRKPSYSRLDL